MCLVCTTEAHTHTHTHKLINSQISEDLRTVRSEETHTHTHTTTASPLTRAQTWRCEDERDSPEGGWKTTTWWVCEQLRGKETERRSGKRNIARNRCRWSWLKDMSTLAKVTFWDKPSSVQPKKKGKKQVLAQGGVNDSDSGERKFFSFFGDAVPLLSFSISSSSPLPVSPPFSCNGKALPSSSHPLLSA